MNQFIRRSIGALALNPATFEEIEADPRALVEAGVVILAVCLAGGFATMSWDQLNATAYMAGVVATILAWSVWVTMIRLIGTGLMRERNTRSNTAELMRTLGYASAPGTLLAFAMIRPAAPLVFAVVGVWMVAGAIVATRQALDFKSTLRAVMTCLAAWLLSFGVFAVVALWSSRTVE